MSQNHTQYHHNYTTNHAAGKKPNLGRSLNFYFQCEQHWSEKLTMFFTNIYSGQKTLHILNVNLFVNFLCALSICLISLSSLVTASVIHYFKSVHISYIYIHTQHFFAHFISMLTMYFLIDILQKEYPFNSYSVYYVHKHVFNFFEQQLEVAQILLCNKCNLIR